MRSLLSLTALGTTALLSVLSAVQGALQPGFCPDCQTFAQAMVPCGGTLTPAQVEINGNYDLQENLAKCQCTAVMQAMLWTCGRCEKANGHQINMPPPNAHRTQCVSKWGITAAAYDAPYDGPVVEGTETKTGSTTNPSTPPPTNGGNGGNGGSKTSDGGSSSTGGANIPSPSTDKSGDSSSESSGPNTTAIGISVGIIGVAIVGGLVAMAMMKRRRHRRHQPLELNPPPLSGFTNLDDQWEKPGHTSSLSGGGGGGSGGSVIGAVEPSVAASRMPMQGRPEPFESRPYADQHQMPPIAYTGPHKHYDGYDGYDGYDNHHPGYDPNYYDPYNQHPYPPQHPQHPQHPSHPPHHDYYDPHGPQQYRNPKGPESVVSGGYV
ncbi:hypothetical protein DFQ26_008799 [Actinomortierella ambigua]|nr:hypothetical protein DFQ26_008799 [Actinomortierella ambigua]